MRGCPRATRTACSSRPARRIVLATNVAETSLTVPRIHYVVDPAWRGSSAASPWQKLDRFAHRGRLAGQRQPARGSLYASRPAPASACIRVPISRGPEFTDPNRRAALAGVILGVMLSLGLGEIEKFPFLEPPDPRAVADGWQQLNRTGAVDIFDADRKLTAIGRTMAEAAGRRETIAHAGRGERAWRAARNAGDR